jgi:hypothetical protein
MLLGSAGVVVIVLQCVWWFENRYWTPETLLSLWLWLGHSFSVRSLGESERVVLWLLDLPLGPALVAVATCAFWLGKRIDP